jgi:bacterial/archaeal transporter family protein
MTYSWLIFAILSAFTAALVAIFGKIGLAKIDTGAATAVRAAVMMVFLFGVLLFQGKLNKLPQVFSDHKALSFIVLSGVAGALSWLFYFLALKNGRAIQVATIDRFSLVFVIVLALFFLGEKITWFSGIGAALMVAGAVLIAIA